MEKGFKLPKGWKYETGTPEEQAFMDARKTKAEATRAANKALGITTTKANNGKSTITSEKFLELLFKPEALPVILPLIKSSLVNNWFKIAQDTLGDISDVDKLQIEYFKEILKNIENYEKNLQNIIVTPAPVPENE